MWPIAFGIVGLIYWPLFIVFILYDLYLSHPMLAMPFLMLCPIIGSANIAGIALSLIGLGRDGTRLGLKIAALFLNVLPLLAITGFLGWLFFGFRM